MTTIGFYVKAGKETGYGHVVRCLALADKLKARGNECVFCYSDPVVANKAVENSHGLTNAILRDPIFDIWIVDLEGGCPPDLAARLRDKCKVLVILNGVGYPDGDPGRLLADLVFYQGVTRRPYELNWAGFQGEWYEGPKWLILREDFQTVRAAPGTHDPPRVVVACGGSDPKRVTDRVIHALPRKAARKPDGFSLEIDVRAIWGPANKAYYGGIDNVFDPPNMARALAWADVACVSYGMTAFECLALGLPTVTLSVSPDHAASADLVAERSGGALVHLGEVEKVSAADIRAAVLGMLATPVCTSKKARAFVDGKGAGRVADKIMEKLKCLES